MFIDMEVAVVTQGNSATELCKMDLLRVVICMVSMTVGTEVLLRLDHVLYFLSPLLSLASSRHARTAVAK